MDNTQEKDRAKDQARAQLDSIIEMVDNLENAETDEEKEQAETAINEDPLSLQVRSGWYEPGRNSDPEEFEILLCTGGPAARIIGELNEYQEPKKAVIEGQDWFTPWLTISMTEEEEEKVLTYCRQFYFGE